MLLRKSVLSWKQAHKHSKALLQRSLITNGFYLVVGTQRHNVIPKHNAGVFMPSTIKMFSSGLISDVDRNEKRTDGNVVISATGADVMDKPFEYASSYDLKDTPYFENISPEILNSIKFRALISALQKQEYEHLTDLYKGVTSSMQFTPEELPYVQNVIAHYYNNTFVQNFTSRNIASVLYAFSLLQFHYESDEQRMALFSLFDKFNSTSPMEKYDFKCVHNFAMHANVKLSSLTKEQIKLFLKRLETVGNKLSQRDMNSLINIVGVMGLKWHLIPSTVQKVFADNIIFEKDIYAKYALSLLHSLARLQFTLWNNRNSGLKRALHDIITAFLLDKRSDKQVINLFRRMGDIGLVNTTLPQTLRSAIRQAVGILIEDDEIPFINLIHGLKLLQFPPNDFNEATQRKMKQRCLDALVTVNNADARTVLYGLAKCNVTFNKMHHNDRTLLLQCIDDQMINGNLAATAGIIASIGEMKVYWNYLSVLTKEHIQSALIVSLPLMSDQALAETIKGLGGMRVPLSDFSVELKDTLTNCVNKCCHRVKTEHLTDIIFGLGKMIHTNTKDGVANNLFQDSILSALERNGKDLHDVSLIIIGLSRIGFKWRALSIGLQQFFVDRVMQDVPQLAPRKLSQLWVGLGLLENNLAEQSPELKHILINRTQTIMQKIMESNLRHLLTGLEFMGVKLSKANYPLEFINSLFIALERDIPNMSSVQFSRFLGILGSLGVKIQPLPDGLKETVVAGFEKHSVYLATQSGESLLDSLKMLSIIAYPWSSLPHSYQVAVRDALQNHMRHDPLPATQIASLVAYLEGMSFKSDSNMDPEFVSLLATVASSALELSATRQRVMKKRFENLLIDMC